MATLHLSVVWKKFSVLDMFLSLDTAFASSSSSSSSRFYTSYATNGRGFFGWFILILQLLLLLLIFYSISNKICAHFQINNYIAFRSQTFITLLGIKTFLGWVLILFLLFENVKNMKKKNKFVFSFKSISLLFTQLRVPPLTN